MELPGDEAGRRAELDLLVPSTVQPAPALDPRLEGVERRAIERPRRAGRIDTGLVHEGHEEEGPARGDEAGDGRGGAGLRPPRGSTGW